jgi:hypothetical protein
VVFPKPKLNDSGRETNYGDVVAAQTMVKVGTLITLGLAIVMETLIILLFGTSNILWGG